MEKKKFIGYDEGFSKEYIDQLYYSLENSPDKLIDAQDESPLLSITITMLAQSAFHNNQGYERLVSLIEKILVKLDGYRNTNHETKLHITETKAKLETEIDNNQALKTINRALDYANQVIDKGVKVEDESMLRLFLTKMDILFNLGRHKEALTVWEDALEYKPTKEDEERRRSIKWEGATMADWYSNPVVHLHIIKGLALLNLDLTEEALNCFKIAYDYSIDYPSRLDSLHNMIICHTHLGLYNEALSNCMETINIYKSTEFPCTERLLHFIYYAYLHYGLISLGQNNLVMMITYIEYSKKFLEENRKYFRFPEDYINEVNHAERLINTILEIRKNNPAAFKGETLESNLTPEEITIFNRKNPFFQIESKNAVLERYVHLTPKYIKEITEFCEQTQDRHLKSELYEFLECLGKAYDKAAIKLIRPMLERIINSIIDNEKVTYGDYERFLLAHPKISYKKKDGRILLDSLNLWVKIQFLRSQFKIRYKKDYENKHKPFFDVVDKLREMLNPDLHAIDEHLYYIPGLIEDFHYILMWYDSYIKQSNKNK